MFLRYLAARSRPAYIPDLAGVGAHPSRAVMWHEEAIQTAGDGSWSFESFSYDLNQDYIYCPLIEPSADGDAFTNGFMLAAGTYNFYVLGAGELNNGKIDWYVDNVLIASGQDWYETGPTYNVLKTVSSVSIGGSGRHVLKGVINGKNASSIGYYMPLSKYWFKSTNDSKSLEL